MIHLIDQFLVVLAVLAGYAVFLLVFPTRECRKCRGWGAKGARRSYCASCGGTGRSFRLGARLVHHGAEQAYRHGREYLRQRREARS